MYNLYKWRVYRIYWEFYDMKVWEKRYYQDDSNPFLVRRIKRTLFKHSREDFETFYYRSWINYPWYRIWVPYLIWSNNELQYVPQKYFYLHVLACEYERRISMIQSSKNKTEDDMQKLEEYRRKYRLYYFRDYY